ncbi:YaaC family protein [Chloroflexota bacterium]
MPDQKIILRYPNDNMVSSALNPLDDILCWVSGFTSKNYVKEIIQTKHSPQVQPTIDERTNEVTQYVHLCCQYIEQATKGPKELAYLPLYYALLNLAKAYISVGKHAIELNMRDNRRHGASYDHSKFSSLDDDSINIHNRGIIPLFYKTLLDTDLPVKDKKLRLKMKQVYPYIRMISAEYAIACGVSSAKLLIPFTISTEDLPNGYQRLKAQWIGDRFINKDELGIPNRLSSLQAFNSMRRINKNDKVLYSKKYKSDDARIWSHVRRNLLYDDIETFGVSKYVFVPVSGESLLLPEELPILCAFYHLSNIVRYNPNALTTLMDSKYWPAILALQSHGLYCFLLLFYGYMTQTRVFFKAK